MTLTLSHVLQAVEELWPLMGAEDWDAPGLVVGDVHREVRHIHLAVDATRSTVTESIDLDADLLITHHPLLMRGVTSVAEERYKGALVADLIRSDTALLAVHTNADVVSTGTSATLAAAMGLVDTRPFEDSVAGGLGRVGRLPAKVLLGDFARTLADVLPSTVPGIRVAGDYAQEIIRVAVCAGAGDAFLTHPAVTTSDVYVTSDLRHHPAQEAREQARSAGGPALIDISHWAAEWLWLATAAEELRSRLPHVEVTVSDLRTDPWDFVVVQ